MKTVLHVRAGIVLLVVAALVLGIALAHRSCNAARSEKAAAERQRQLRGELNEKERRFVALNQKLNKAESRVVTLSALQRDSEKALTALRKRLRNQKVVIDRKSRAVFELTGRLDNLKGQARAQSTGSEAVAYEYRADWFAFRTPDVFATGGESVEFFSLYPEIEVYGLGTENGALKSERIEISFADREGRPIPIHAEIKDYVLDYAVPAPPGPRWYENVHLDLHGHVACALPVKAEDASATAGVTASFWNVELTAQIGTDFALRPAFAIGAGYRWRFF